MNYTLESATIQISKKYRYKDSEQLFHHGEFYGGNKPKVISYFLDERARQEKLFPEEYNTMDRWINLLGEEFGEVCKANIEHNPENLKEELVQLGALAMRVLELIEENESDAKEISREANKESIKA